MSPAALADPAVTADQLEAWRRRGWLLIPGLIEPELIAATRAAFADVAESMLGQLRAEGLIADTRPDLPFERRFAVAAGAHAARLGRSWRKQVAGEAVYRLHHAPRLVSTIETLLDDGVMGHSVFNARPKLPDQQLTVVPWHQDSGYFGVDSAKQTIVTAWVPLVEVSAENGGLQLADGSHRYGLVHHVTESREGQFLEIEHAEPSPEAVVDIAMRPGDVLMFGNLLWHRSVANRSDGIRWSIDLRFYPESLAGRCASDEFAEPWAIRARNRPTTSYERWAEMTRDARW
jgi:ectoine hydroxylase-related dioxygenase (phytanoyl-CoA dioxygenase family)